MGLRWVKEYPKARQVFHLADQILGWSISEIAFHGPDSELRKTINSQPAIFVLDCASWVLFEDLLPAAVAGHSLGEFAALVASGVLSFPQTLEMVKVRAEIMEESARSSPGIMIAVLGAGLEVIENVVQRLGKKGIVAVANYNCPGQVVVSSEAGILTELTEELLKQGAKKVVNLPVSGGFHSPLVSTAAKNFRTYLEGIKFNDAKIPLVSNFSGSASINSQEIKRNLAYQMDSPVNWEKSVRWMLDQGIDTFLELGPGKVLKGLVKRIAPQAKVKSVEEASVDELRKWLLKEIF